MKEFNFHNNDFAGGHGSDFPRGDEFEQLIREKTEQYKMYPSENVWKGVHNSLHTRRKWFIGSMALLVTGILVFSGKELLTPSHASTRKLAAASQAATDNVNADPARANQPEENPRANFVRIHPANIAAAGKHSNSSGTSAVDADETDQPLNHLAITISHPVVSQPDLSELLSHAVQLPGETPSLIASRGAEETMPKAPAPARSTPGLLDSWLVRNATESPARRSADAAAQHNTAEAFRETPEPSRETAETGTKGLDADDALVRGALESLSARGQKIHRSLDRTQSAFNTSVSGNIRDSAGGAKASIDAIGEASDLSRVNWLHDYAMYTLVPSTSRGRLFFQLVLAPTINYRTLSGGTLASSKSLGGSGSSIRAGDMQSWVNHSPAVGFEFGGNLLFRVTRNLTVKGGLQFNYSRYKMVAYTNSTPPTQQPASYRTLLGNDLYMDSIAAVAPTAQGPTPNVVPNIIQATLYNDYYQLSAPIGFELRVLGNERLQFNLGATIQPSYLLNTNSYVLTSDYTGYDKQPSVFRRWNLSGGVEAFVSYQMGPVRWQIGPEFRYQLFSTYLNNGPYPITENLKGYGIKLGITKPLP
jgi:hypothetical protein